MNTITVVVLSVLSYTVYKLYNYFKVPEELKHLNGVSIFKMVEAFLNRKSFDEQIENVYKPALKDGKARFWTQGSWEIVLTDTKHIKEIFNRTDKFLKRPPNDESTKAMLARQFLGDSNVVGNDGEEWKRHRKVVNPALKKKWSPELFGKLTFHMIDKIEEFKEAPIEVLDLFQRLTLDALGLGLFSYNFKALEQGSEDLNLNAYHEIMKAMFNPIYFMVPYLEYVVPSRYEARSKLIKFKSWLDSIIQERKQDVTNNLFKDDLLTLMIQANNTEGDVGLTDEETINNLATFFIAGHDTTANTLTTTMYYLAKHQDIQEKARAEVISILGDKEVKVPDFDQQKDFNYINAIIKESMRIITTVAMLRRYCPEGMTLADGYVVPKNTFVRLMPWLVHHNEEHFAKPNTFMPERFLDPSNNLEPNWVPFGGGTRICAGMNFSLIEQRVVLAILLQKYYIKLGPKSKERDTPYLSSGGLVRPTNMDVIFIKRD